MRCYFLLIVARSQVVMRTVISFSTVRVLCSPGSATSPSTSGPVDVSFRQTCDRQSKDVRNPKNNNVKSKASFSMPDNGEKSQYCHHKFKIVDQKGFLRQYYAILDDPVLRSNIS